MPDPDWLAERMPAHLLGEWQAFERHYGPLLLHERVDYGLAVLRAIGEGSREVTLPPWYRKPEMDDDALWGMLTAMSERKYPEVRERGG